MSEVTSENCYLQLSLIFHIFRVSVTILFYKRGDNASWIFRNFLVVASSQPMEYNVTFILITLEIFYLDRCIPFFFSFRTKNQENKVDPYREKAVNSKF